MERGSARLGWVGASCERTGFGLLLGIAPSSGNVNAGARVCKRKFGDRLPRVYPNAEFGRDENGEAMLKGLDPLLTPDLLHALRSMGHGDVVALVDANFPAHSVAAGTVVGRPVLLNADLATAAAAILSVMPLDVFEPGAVRRMDLVDEPDHVPSVQGEIIEIALAASGRAIEPQGYARHDFYAMARQAYVVVQTAERRLYGCVAFVKGVVGPDG